jgi:hypothetical protein
VECGSALLCRFGFSGFPSIFSVEKDSALLLSTEKIAKTKAAEAKPLPHST